MFLSDLGEQQAGRLPSEHEQPARLSRAAVRQRQVRLRRSACVHEQSADDLRRPGFRFLPRQTPWNLRRRQQRALRRLHSALWKGMRLAYREISKGVPA